MRSGIALIESLRPAQWTKNLLLFAALVFGRRAGDPEAVISASLGFLLFCAASSGVYLLNDIRDAESDRRHPLKRDRPIASGALSERWAAILSAFLLLASVATAPLLGSAFTLTLAAYVLLQVLYSFGLKRLVLVDVFCVAVGFVLRAVAGAFAVDVDISPWLLVCSLTLALFLALAKRRHEVVLLEVSAREHRASLTEYSPYLLDQLIGVVTATTVVAYALYTLAPDTVEKFGTSNLVFTVPFVIYGVFRYLLLVHEKKRGEDPTKMFLTDRALLLNTALWLLLSALLIYGAGFRS